MKFLPLGDRAIMIALGDSIDEATRLRVRAVSAALDATRLIAVVDQVPAFASIAVHYDPAAVPGSGDQSPYERMVALLEQVLANGAADTAAAVRTVDIPVCYGGELGPDLDDVAHAHGLEPDEVVRIHSAAEYVVYMVGFMPGFAYLGGLPDRIATPRRPSPRRTVPAGAVGIGGQQTGVYPMESPGGWNLIGRTPVQMFDIARSEPSLLAAGDRVRFNPIDAGEYLARREYP